MPRTVAETSIAVRIASVGVSGSYTADQGIGRAGGPSYLGIPATNTSATRTAHTHIGVVWS